MNRSKDPTIRRLITDSVMTGEQWQLYFTLELLDRLQYLATWQATDWASRVYRCMYNDISPETAARCCAALYDWPSEGLSPTACG